MSEHIRTRTQRHGPERLRSFDEATGSPHSAGPPNARPDGDPIDPERIAQVCQSVRECLTAGRWSGAANFARSAREPAAFVELGQVDGPCLGVAAAGFVADLVDVHLQMARVYGAVNAIVARQADPGLRKAGDIKPDSPIAALDGYVSDEGRRKLARKGLATVGELVELLERCISDQGRPSGAFSRDCNGVDAECTEVLWFLGQLGPRRSAYWEQQKRANQVHEPPKDVRERLRRDRAWQAKYDQKRRQESEVA